MYPITNYTYSQAKKIGVVVKPSTNKTKKIDVYKQGKKIASVGANGMNDFPTYIKKMGFRTTVIDTQMIIELFCYFTIKYNTGINKLIKFQEDNHF